MKRVALTILLMAACSDQTPPLTRDQLLDPAACESCHPQHYVEWSGSSHAYAADDPVFQAMNTRFLRDTGEDPATCLRCHAPVALAEGATSDGRNLSSVESALKGVTCYACHVVAHANPATHQFELAGDGIMLGGIADPIGTGAHESAYSTLLDRNIWRSTDLCGACHDFETSSGVHVHRTYTEWSESMFADTFSQLFLSCGGCHMDSKSDVVATGDVPTRRRHNHKLPGINVALIPWPETEAQLQAVQHDLASALFAQICLAAPTEPLEITLDNVMGGHLFPSGDASTRRVWVEVVAYKGQNVIFQSGVVEEGTAVVSTRTSDPNLWMLGDRLLDAEGAEVTFPWQAVSVESTGLVGALTNDSTDPRYYHAVTKEYPVLPQAPDRITMAVKVRPVGLDIIDALIAGGDLDAAVRSRIPTHTLEGSRIEWTAQQGGCVPNPTQ